MHLHVSSTCAHRQEVKIALHSLWYHHTETSEWSKITKIQFYKYKHIRYIKNNDPRSAYALHVLNCRHEYMNECTSSRSTIIMNSSPNNIWTSIILCLTSFIHILHVITHLTPNPQSHAFQPVLSQPVHQKATYRVSTF